MKIDKLPVNKEIAKALSELVKSLERRADFYAAFLRTGEIPAQALKIARDLGVERDKIALQLDKAINTQVKRIHKK